MHAFEQVMDFFALFFGFAAEEILPDLPASRQSQFHVFVHGQAFEHRRGLEFSPDTQTGDIRFAFPCDIDIIEHDPTAGDTGLAADDIAERGLAGAVGADDDA